MEKQIEKTEQQFEYLKLLSETEELQSETIRLLDIVGVQCLSSGAPFESWAIAPQDPSIEKILARIPGIKAVSHEEPPSCK